MLRRPFALVGGLQLMWWVGFNLSVAVAVEFIALADVAAETGRIGGTTFHPRRSYRRRRGRRRRARSPEMMTVVAIMAGLLPSLRSHGTGSEIMQRTAVPGSMVSSTVLTLVVIRRFMRL